MSRHFLNNTHKLTVTLEPDEEFGKHLADREDSVLKEKIANLTDQGKNKYSRLCCCYCSQNQRFVYIL